MRMLLVVAVAVVGCGPYGASRVGQTCDAGPRVQACSSPTTFQACDTSESFAVWREYPCQAACGEGSECPLETSKHGTTCPASWKGVHLCKGPQVAIACVDGAWKQWGCTTCPAGQTCFDFACTCG